MIDLFTLGNLKGRPINIKICFKALFGFVKVGIVLVILFENRPLRIMLVYEESYKASYTDLTFSIDPECTYLHVYEHTKGGHKHKLFWYSYIHNALQCLTGKVDNNNK